MKISFVKRFFPAVIFAALLIVPARLVKAQEASSNSPSVAGQSTPEAQSPAKDKQEVDENDQYLHSDTVRGLGAKVGLNAEQAATAFTVVNFVVLAGLLGWFALRRFLKR